LICNKCNKLAKRPTHGTKGQVFPESAAPQSDLSVAVSTEISVPADNNAQASSTEPTSAAQESEYCAPESLVTEESDLLDDSDHDELWTSTSLHDLGEPFDVYDVTYKGGLPELPKAKLGRIGLEIYADRFRLTARNISSRGFWNEFEILFKDVFDVEIVDRNVSTFEALAGGLNSRQLNQKNNIHITYAVPEGRRVLRFEMLSGVTVMAQARKCREFEDLLRTHQIPSQFRSQAAPSSETSAPSLGDEIAKLSALHKDGILTDEEFASGKANLLNQ
jgi:hypothetical protein